jgi:hypothetical protein
MEKGHITFKEAVKTGQLQQFIAQEEARGIGAIERLELDAAIAEALKKIRANRRTQQSPSRNGSAK